MITTTKYGLKMPEASDSADLRIYVGDNMILLDGHTHLWADITDKPTTFAPSTHTHSYASLTGIPSTFTPSTHTHSYSSLTGIPATFTPSTHTHSYGSLTGIPTTFTPSAHTHLWVDITDKPSTFTPSTHTHLWADITDKPTSFTPATHTHLWADITDKPTTFTPATHTHAYSSLTGIPTTFTPSAHTHAIFTTTADGFVPKTTTSNTTDYLRRDGTWATPPSVALWGNITGTLSNQTDLQNALNAKFNSTGGTLGGSLNMGNFNITNVNNLSFNDVGVNEGIEWTDATNNWKIYVSPDDLTNATGGIQFVDNGIRKATIQPTGEIVSISGGFTVTNPNNINATVGLNWLNDKPRIRYGGTGVGYDAGFSIQGAGDSVKFKANNDGSCVVGGSRLYFNQATWGDTSLEKPNIEAVDAGLYLHHSSTDYLRVKNGEMNFYSGGNDHIGIYWYGSIKFHRTEAWLESRADVTAPCGIRAPMDYAYAQARDGLRVTAPFSMSGWKPVLASAFTVNSYREDKTNITELQNGALNKVLSAKIYDYHLTDELEEIEGFEGGDTRKPKIKTKDPKKVKKRLGLIHDETPIEILEHGQMIDLYGMCSLLWKSVQELYAEVQLLKAK